MTATLLNVDSDDSLDEEALIADMGKDVRILHIEDEPAFADLVTEFLHRERDDFDVVTETDPRDGLERITEGDVDCVVSDYDMPGIDGLDVLETVRETCPRLPFILFTGKGSEEIASEAISKGVTDYLQKQSGTEQYEVLANRIEQAVARYRAEQHVERGFQAIETAHDGISLLNDDGEFIYVNQPYAEITGYDRDELLGQHFEILYSEETLDHVYEEVIPAAKADEWNGTSVYLTKDGEPVHVEHSLSYTSEDTMVCTISETDAKMRERLSLRERAMDEAPVGITISDATRDDNPIVYTNDGFVELTGYSKEETKGWNHRFLQGEATREAPVAEMRRAIDAAEQVTVELRNYRKDGTEFWNRVTIAPLFDENGELEHFVGFQEDVSNRRELVEQFSSLGEVLSHDLKNPLRTLEGRLKLALETEDLDHVENAMNSLDRVEQLIDDIADVMKSGTIVGEHEEIDVAQLAAAVWESLNSHDTSNDLTVADGVTVMGDADAVGRLLENLFWNALEHSDQPVTVRIGELSDGFYVEDDGPGIPDEYREAVFERGFSTKDNDEGTGLGLASAQQIALAHNWRIDVVEAHGLGGARFEVTGTGMT